MLKHVTCLIVYLFIVNTEGIPIEKSQENVNKTAHDDQDDLELNNINGYLERRKNIMDKYYARINKNKSLENETIRQEPKNDSATTIQPVTMDRTITFGKCENSSISILRYTLTINGGSSSGNTFEYSESNVCIVCVTMENIENIRVLIQSGGPGDDHVHLKFDPTLATTSRVVVNVKGRQNKCGT